MFDPSLVARYHSGMGNIAPQPQVQRPQANPFGNYLQSLSQGLAGGNYQAAPQGHPGMGMMQYSPQNYQAAPQGRHPWEM